jgi:hypothetical protein
MATEQHDAYILKMQSEAAQAYAQQRYLDAKALDPDDPDAASNPDYGKPLDEKIYDHVTSRESRPETTTYQSRAARIDMRKKQKNYSQGRI